MLVHEIYRKCVAFLCLTDARATWRPIGTAFFVAVPIAENTGALYLVTARHVVEGAAACDVSLHLRVNRKDSTGAEFLRLDPDAWHRAYNTDVAVMQLSPQTADDFAIEWIRPTQIATSSVLAARGAGPGDEVFFSGLFTEFPGIQRAEPVIRFGTISMMPNEPVTIRNADCSESQVEAFLVEARSWGGQSGSPAFIFFPGDRRPGYLHLPSLATGPGDTVAIPDSVMPQLLGLVHGHYNVRADVAFTGDVFGSAHVPINAGIAIVIPAQKIIDTLMMEEVVKERKTNEGDNKNLPTPDIARDQTGEYERFEELARKLVNTPKPDTEKRKDAS